MMVVYVLTIIIFKIIEINTIKLFLDKNLLINIIKIIRKIIKYLKCNNYYNINLIYIGRSVSPQ